MKGVVFIALNDMVEKRFGIDTWESILAQVAPECQGVYTSTEEYPDEDIIKFVSVISETLALPSSEITQTFGHYLFGELNRKYTLFSASCSTLFDFLGSIETVIHKEVKKLYINPNLPTLGCTVTDERNLLMRYHSPRKLCYLAEGLILGAAKHYDEPVVITHDVCMHRGAKVCELKVCLH